MKWTNPRVDLHEHLKLVNNYAFKITALKTSAKKTYFEERGYFF